MVVGIMNQYEDWRAERRRLNDLEDAYWSGAELQEDPDWEESDDMGCALAVDFGEHYENVLSAVSMIVRAWNGESNEPSLGEAVTALVELVELDTESSASRQHWIDNGRYLQLGEVVTQ